MSIHPLEPPDSITRATRAIEIIRIWSVDGEPHFSVRVTPEQSPVGWGLVLVDIARLVAEGYAEHTKTTTAEVMNEIRQGFDAEWRHPTDEDS